MLAHLRFPLCSKQLSEYKKQPSVKGCLLACFIAEGRKKAFKLHFFISENIFCNATAIRFWNMMPFVTSLSGTMRRKNEKNPPTGSGIEAARKDFVFFSRKRRPLSQTQLIFDHGESWKLWDTVFCKHLRPFHIRWTTHWWFHRWIKALLVMWMLLFFLYTYYRLDSTHGIIHVSISVLHMWTSRFRIWDKNYPDYAENYEGKCLMYHEYFSICWFRVRQDMVLYMFYWCVITAAMKAPYFSNSVHYIYDLSAPTSHSCSSIVHDKPGISRRSGHI